MCVVYCVNVCTQICTVGCGAQRRTLVSSFITVLLRLWSVTDTGIQLGCLVSKHQCTSLSSPKCHYYENASKGCDSVCTLSGEAQASVPSRGGRKLEALLNDPERDAKLPLEMLKTFSLPRLGFHFIGSAFSNKHEFQIEKMK